MIGIVIDLHLRTGPIRIRSLFAHAVKNPAVRSFRDLPIECQFEILELFPRDQICARPAEAPQYAAIFTYPVRGKGLLLKSAKLISQRLASGQRSPS